MQSKDFTDFFEKTTRSDLLLVFYQTPASPVCHMASLVERCTLANMVKNSSNRREKVKLEPVADPFSAAQWKFSLINLPENFYYYSNFFVSRSDPERVNFELVFCQIITVSLKHSQIFYENVVRKFTYCSKMSFLIIWNNFYAC